MTMKKNIRLNDYDLNGYFLLLLSICLSFSFHLKCGKLKVQDTWVHDANKLCKDESVLLPLFFTRILHTTWCYPHFADVKTEEG